VPGRLFLERPIAEIAAWAAMDVGPTANEPRRRNISPGQEIIVGQGSALGYMRWGIIPVGRKNARGRPVMETIINARSETVFDKSAFEGVGRAIIPCDGWYEWTGEKRKKTAWRIRPKSGAPMAFAAISDIWKAPGGLEVAQAAAVTCEPNADVRDIHHRMGVILNPDQFDTWLHAPEAEAATLMRPFADGELHVEKALDVDWTAA